MKGDTPLLFTYNDYKAYIRARISASSQARGLVSAFADAAGCQRSYFSQAIHSHVHLTQDHAVGLAEYWSLNEIETDYFCTLVDFERAATPKLKNKLKARLASLKKSQEDLSKRFKQDSLEPGERELTYYSAWYYSAIHVLTSIPQFQQAEKIADRLALPLVRVNRILRTLERDKLVRRDGAFWHLGVGDLHVPQKSLLSAIHHSNWRARAVQDAQDPDSRGIHYTAVSSLSHDDFENLKALLLAFIEQTRQVVASSPEQELMTFTCDLFNV